MNNSISEIRCATTSSNKESNFLDDQDGVISTGSFDGNNSNNDKNKWLNNSIPWLALTRNRRVPVFSSVKRFSELHSISTTIVWINCCFLENSNRLNANQKCIFLPPNVPIRSKFAAAWLMGRPFWHTSQCDSSPVARSDSRKTCILHNRMLVLR